MTDDDEERPVVTIFRSRLREDAASGYAAMAAEMDRLARSMPGFVEAKSFTAEDGERLTLVTFADRVSHEAWRDHPRHQDAQRRGRERFYAEYQVRVCRSERTSSFVRPH